MTTDRGVVVLAVTVTVVAVLFGPLVPAVERPRPPDAGEPVFDALADDRPVEVTRTLSFRVVTPPTNATVADGVVTTSPATVAVAAGDDPVRIRFRLRVGTRSADRSAVVRPGTSTTLTAAPSVPADAPTPVSTATFEVAVATGDDGPYRTLYTTTLPVTDDVR